VSPLKTSLVASMAKSLNLPIDAVLTDISCQLAISDAVLLQAEPGAGKSTQVP
jgi:HrpA-like RNA helicase